MHKRLSSKNGLSPDKVATVFPFQKSTFSSGLREVGSQQSKREQISKDLEPLANGPFSHGEEKLLAHLSPREVGIFARANQNSASETSAARSLSLFRRVLDREDRNALEQFWSGFAGTEEEAGTLVTQSQGGGYQRKAASHALVRSKLFDLAKTLPNPKLAAKYSDQKLLDKDLFDVLKHCTEQQRKQFARSVVQIGLQDSELEKYLGTKFVNIAQQYPAKERGELVMEIVGSPRSKELHDIAAGLLLSTRGSADLKDVFDHVDKKAALLSDIPAVRSALAVVDISPAVKAVQLPSKLDSNADKSTIAKTLKELDAALKSIGKLAKREPLLMQTPYAAAIQKIVRTNTADIKSSIKPLQSPAEKVNRINTMLEKLPAELKYGIAITNSDIGDNSRWTIGEVQDVKQSLARLPEGRLIFTPQLNEIQRVASLGPRVMGQRFDDGVVRIADLAVNNRYVSLSYDNTPSLQAILAHEIGHSIQLGDVVPMIQNGDLPKKGDPLYDFDEYMEIAGWEVITPNRYNLKNSGLSLEVDGEHHAMGVPVFHNGKNVVFSYNQGVLFQRDVNGEFSLITYGRTNPWEDWAETFCEYALLPERLIEFAPSKFRYFEHEFGLYKRNTHLAQLLEKSVAKRANNP